jgi:tetratricopeptide (TPR) repeat protein
MSEAFRGIVPRDEGYEMATRSAQRALALNPAVPEAHGVLGRIAQDYRWDYAAADRHFQRAIELSPGSEVWHRQRGRLLSVLGRHDEAIALARRSTTLDPLAPGAFRYLGSIQYRARQYDAALESFTRALAIAPDQPYALGSAADALSAKGRHAESIAAADRALRLAPDDPIVVSAAGAAHAAAGDSAEARRLVARLLAFPSPSPFLAAEVLAQLGDRERMFELLERAAAERDPLLTEIGSVPLFDPFRADPRMGRLFSRIGLELRPAPAR